MARLCLVGLLSVCAWAAAGDDLLQAHGNVEQVTLHSGLGLGLDGSPKRVAIIGAGSAGSSAAYYLSRYAKANVTVFERNAYIGGRSTTVSVFGDASEPVELGASIFVQANRNLVQAVHDLNLTTTKGPGAAAGDGGGNGRIGVFNGGDFVFTADGAQNSLWDLVKLFWRYGWAPLRAQRTMKRVVGQFLTLYDQPIFPFDSLSDAAYEAGLTAVTAATGAQYLRENEVGDAFANEIVQASTRVNYASNLNQIHGLETMVCLAAENATSIQGGNWQIFDRMIKASKARVLLGTTVHDVHSNEDGSHVLLHSKGGRDAGTFHEDVFDEVILAAPFHQSAVTFSPRLAHTPDDIPYRRLEVTLFATAARLSPLFFGLADDADVPDIVLTTLPPAGSGVAQTRFFSISLIRRVWNRETQRKESLYKIFSPEPLDDEFLGSLLASDDLADAITWSYTKSWLSYPYLPPRITFEEIKLGRGLWYTGGIESFISTMETSSLMGHNVARLMADSWHH